jgi:hypothetical protein
MRFTFCIAALILTALQSANAQPDVEQMEGAVVMLKCSFPVMKNMNGKDYEVWLRDRDSGVLAPAIEREEAGTGFLLQSKTNCFIGTAGHIAGSMTDRCVVTARAADNTPVQINLTDLIDSPSADAPGKVHWLRHPIADCALHPLNRSRPGFAKLSHVVWIPTEILATELNAPSKADLLTALGFPLGYGTEVTFAPLTKESKAASGLRSEGGVYFFLMQEPGIAGFSGAPFFTSGAPRMMFSPTNIAVVFSRTTCWGLLSRTDGDSTGGKMARVIHSRHLVELITDFEKPPALATKVVPTTAKTVVRENSSEQK